TRPRDRQRGRGSGVQAGPALRVGNGQAPHRRRATPDRRVPAPARAALPRSPQLTPGRSLSAELLALLDPLETPPLRRVEHKVGAHWKGDRGGDDQRPDLPRKNPKQDQTDDDATDRELHSTRHFASSRPRTAVASRTRLSSPHPGLTR